MQKTTTRPLIIALTLILAVGAGLWFLGLGVLYAYLIAINLATMLFYGHDKRRAIRQRSRIPEIVLHLLALAGGTVGAFAGQTIFRHKTIKTRFRIVFVLTVILQAVLLGAYIYYMTQSS